MRKEMLKELEQSNYNEAFQIIKRNPMLHLQLEDITILLNHLDDIDSETEDRSKAKSDISSLIYRRSQRQNVLRGFGCVDKAYPENSTDISPLKLEELTGLSIASLTPKQRTTYWRVAGIGLCVAEYIIGTNLGIDPIYTLIPATFFLLGVDQLVYKGAFFESCYQTLFPEYKKKVICHEAGHFLIAYLLGLPVSSCVTNAWQARKYPEIRGQAGTVFTDSKLNDEMKTQKVSRSSLDRLSVVLMAGIAAEALQFGNAEGGASDEQELFSLLTQVQPPWNLIRIQGQARWAAVQALLLIKEHRQSFNALYQVLCDGKPVGDCVSEIEKNLPTVLPSLQRSEERKRVLRELERNSLLKYVQRVTYRVGGIERVGSDEVTLLSEATHIDKDGYITKFNPSSSTLAVTVTPRNEDVAVSNLPPNQDQSLSSFTESIRLLEKAAITGRINITDQESAAGGGIWINGLRSYGDSKGMMSVPSSSPSLAVSSGDEFTFPKPVKGYEEKLELLTGVNSSESTESTAMKLLKSHRSFLIKKLENQLIYNSHQV
jgi:hypothetical protein